jgi:hypothetical protein
MPNETRDTLLRQHETAWKLMTFHVRDLTTAECMWRPTQLGPHVRLHAGVWVADWPEREDYQIGAPTIAWLTWHVGYWWSMVLDHSFGSRTLRRELVTWPGDADGVRSWFNALHERWEGEVRRLNDAELMSIERARWPFSQRCFADVSAWANLELMKNAAEIGYARFLYAARATDAPV